MNWGPVVGVVIEVLGLGFTAFILGRAWLDVGKGFSLLTGRSRQPVTGVAASGLLALRAYAGGHLVNGNETNEEAIADIRRELTALDVRLRQVEDATGDVEQRLRDELTALEARRHEEARTQARGDTRTALFGLAVAAIGWIVQFLSSPPWA